MHPTTAPSVPPSSPFVGDSPGRRSTATPDIASRHRFFGWSNGLLFVLLALGCMSGKGLAQSLPLTTLKHFVAPGGLYPNSGVLRVGSVLYGTAYRGGNTGNGIVYKVNTDGTGFTVLRNFNGTDGAFPNAPLVISSTTLYGVTMNGGSAGVGVLFKIRTDGTGFSVLKTFTGADGGNPSGGLFLSGNMLFGTTLSGGAAGRGTVFKINTDGTGFVQLKSFATTDLARPYGTLTAIGTTLFGTTYQGGAADLGGVFKLNFDGTSFAVLKEFTGIDGAQPYGGLVPVGNTLFGTTSSGGAAGNGTIYSISDTGAGFTVVRDLMTLDGTAPSGGLLLSSDKIYGTTFSGGDHGNGTVFALSTNGTGFSVLRHFEPLEGTKSFATLAISGGTLYGTSSQGGVAGNGTIFRLNTDGTAFGIVRNFTVDDGLTPYAGLVLSGSSLFGTTSSGGSGGSGNIFRVNTDGTGFVVLKSFNGLDGSYPWSTMVESGGTLYGTTVTGGAEAAGTVYKINTDGTGFAVLKTFSLSEGAYPYEKLVLSGSTLYGTAYQGGSANSGCVFKVNTDGTGFAVLKEFRGDDGAFPWASLVLSGSYLYGSTFEGGNGGYGTLYRVRVDGTDFSVLKHFSGASDGSKPYARLTVTNNTIYGTTSTGGTGDFGTIFRLNTDGTGFTTLRHLASSDGINPYAELLLSGNTLYGTASGGGSSGNGTIFKINVDGTAFTVLKRLSSTEGGYPNAALVLSDGTLFGTAYQAGANGSGSIFKISTSGTGFSVVKNFSGSDGAYPYSGLLLSGITVYGTTSAGGTGGFGTVFSVPTKAAQTITFAAPADRPYGSASFTISATASSGLPVTFSSVTPLVATVSGNTVTILKAGVATIRASQAGNTVYAPALNVDRSFTVTAAPLVARANDAVRDYAQLNPTFSGSLTGAVLADGITASFVCAATVSSDAGAYAITPVLNDPNGRLANYSVTLTPGTLRIDPILQAISFAPIPAKQYGDVSFNVSPTASSGLPVTLSSSTPTVASVSGNQIAILSAGTATIQAVQPGNINYKPAATVTRTFTVNPAPLLAQANDAARQYGLPNPVFSGSINGVIGDDGITAGFGSAATESSDVGNYPIVPVLNDPNGKLANYSTTLIPGSLRIDATTQEISFDELSAKRFGDAPFTVSATSSSALTVQFSSLTPTVASVTGNLVTILSAGTAILQADQPGNLNYQAATPVTRSFTVLRQTPVVIWPNPPPIDAATPLSSAQLNATASVPGSFVYNPPTDSVLGVGDGQVLSVVFTPDDTLNYETVSATTAINVTRIQPKVSWATPADIPYGTALSSAQLNASANIPGEFTYNPPQGTVLPLGDQRPLQVQFVPSDPALYTSAQASVKVNVYQTLDHGSRYDRVASFDGGTGSGAQPSAALTRGTDGKWYGTTSSGGTNDAGTVFSVNSDGTQFNSIHDFGADPNDGRDPRGSVIEALDGNLYGTTYEGGAAGAGTVYRLSKDGLAYTTIYSFDPAKGQADSPHSGLIDGADGYLYGTAFKGGSGGGGSLFRLRYDGSDFSELHAFGPAPSDGTYPLAGVILGPDGALYGVTQRGGAGGWGTVYRIERDGTRYQLLRQFSNVGTEGYDLRFPITLGRDGALYGVAVNGGLHQLGTVFKLLIDGSGYGSVHHFTDSNPSGGMSLGRDGFLYGITAAGGAHDSGTVFRLTGNGTGFESLFSFANVPGDGTSPYGGLASDIEGNLYGVTVYGGDANLGTVFRLALASHELLVRSDQYETSEEAVLTLPAPGLFSNDEYFKGVQPLVIQFRGRANPTSSDFEPGTSFVGSFGIDPSSIGILSADPTLTWIYPAPLGHWDLSTSQSGFAFRGDATEVGVGNDLPNGDRYVVTLTNGSSAGVPLPSGKTVNSVKLELVSPAGTTPALLGDDSIQLVPPSLTSAGSVTGTIQFDDGTSSLFDLTSLWAGPWVSRINGEAAKVDQPFALPSGAVLLVHADGSFSYDPSSRTQDLAPGQRATETFEYEVEDSDGAKATASVTIEVFGVNHPPIAGLVQITTTEDSAVGVQLMGSDPDGDGVTYQISRAPSHGVLTADAAAGSFVYTPAPDYQGSDDFTYTVSDGRGASAAGTVEITITPVNDPPVGLNQSLFTYANRPIPVTLSGSDVDGDPITYSVLVPPLHGDLGGQAPNITYTPHHQFQGYDSLEFQLDDGNGGITTAKVNITVGLSPIWQARVGGDRSASSWVGATGSRFGRVYVVANEYFAASSSFGVTVSKYDEDGVRAWVKNFQDHSTNEAAVATLGQAVTADSEGSVYVATFSQWYEGEEYRSARVLVKLDSQGNQLWSRRVEAAPDQVELPIALAANSSGTVVMSCQLAGGVGHDARVISYDSLGNETYSVSLPLFLPRALSLDDAGAAYVAGASIDSGRAMRTIKLGADGQILWSARYQSSVPGWDEARALVVTPTGNVGVVGISMGSQGELDFVTVKYSTEGAELFVSRFDGMQNGTDVPRAIAVGPEDSLVVTGTSYDDPLYTLGLVSDVSELQAEQWGNGAQAVTLKYEADGAVLWTRRGVQNPEESSYGTCVNVDSSGLVYVAGSSVAPGGSPIMLSLAYDSGGALLWESRNQTEGFFYSVGMAQVLLNQGEAVVVGPAYSSGGGSDLVLAKFAQTPRGAAVTALDPSWAPANGPGLTLRVLGRSFTPSSQVFWNGSLRSTRYVSWSELQAVIPAEDLQTSGDLVPAAVTVRRATGEESLAVAFAVTGSSVADVRAQYVEFGTTNQVTLVPTTEGTAGVSGSVSNNGNSIPTSVFAVRYNGNPTGVDIFDAGGGFTGLSAWPGDEGDRVAATFYYGTGANGEHEEDLVLLYLRGSAWVPVVGASGAAPVHDSVDNRDGSISGGQFRVEFDPTSQPKITELSSTHFTVSRILAPTITLQPASGSPFVGDNVVLTVVATGHQPMRYQWLRDGVELAGATSATLSLPAVQLSDSASYSVRVSNLGGTLDSEAAVLSVQRIVPVLSWSKPADIVYGKPLGTEELNATCAVPGTWSYSPSANARLLPGNDQLLTAVFQPSEASKYSSASISVRINVRKAPLVVRANNLSKVYGAATPSLTASYSGFVYGETASVLLTQPSLTSAVNALSSVGNYPITISGATATNYEITHVNGSLAVVPAPLVVTAANATKLYGTTLPTLTLTYAGFVNGNGPNDLASPVVVTTTATAGSDVGSYAIIPSGATSPNYTITFVPGTLSVSPVPLTITAANRTMKYGAALPSFSATYTGFVNGDTATSLDVPPSFSTPATSASPVGSYPISVSRAADLNYTITFVGATLTVQPADLTVSAQATTKNYGDPVPSLVASYSGLVNGDTPSVLAGSLSLSSTVTDSTPAGTYPIRVTGSLSASNYTVRIVDGTFTVAKAPLTITADTKSKIVGAPIPPLTYTVSGFVLGQTESVFLTPVAISAAATATSPPGVYRISVSGATAANYAIRFVGGQLKVYAQ